MGFAENTRGPKPKSRKNIDQTSLKNIEVKKEPYVENIERKTAILAKKPEINAHPTDSYYYLSQNGEKIPVSQENLQ